MSYFRWKGVIITGEIKKGKLVAHSHDDLYARLFKKGIALLSAKEMYTPHFYWPISAQNKSSVFKHSAKLLRAGILLPQSLIIVAEQSGNPFLYDMFFTLSTDLQKGVPFLSALQKQSLLNEPIVKIMLIAGHDSGNVMNAMENVALYYHQNYLFSKNIRSVLAMPALTLLFFIGISTFIFIVIIPRFADMFTSFNQELPVLTYYMIVMSNFMSSYLMMYAVFLLIGIAYSLYYWRIALRIKVWNRIVLNIPFIGTFVWQHHMCQILQALSLLISSGVTLVAALHVVIDSINNERIKNQCILLHDEVASGHLLSDAMARSGLFLPEVLAFIHVGEESGTLAQALQDASVAYGIVLERSMQHCTFFLQPIVIMILGFLITILIFSVYLPVLQFSHVL